MFLIDFYTIEIFSSKISSINLSLFQNNVSKFRSNFPKISSFSSLFFLPIKISSQIIWQDGVFLDVGEKPDQWSTANIIPIPKKGDLTEPTNYRGISLSSLVAKALNRMVLNRLKPEIETILRRNGRSTTQQILVLRRLIEGVKSRKLPAVLTFIDFKKAFDSVHRGKMLKILEAYGIPVKLVELIRLMYEKTMAKVLQTEKRNCSRY